MNKTRLLLSLFCLLALVISGCGGGGGGATETTPTASNPTVTLSGTVHSVTGFSAPSKGSGLNRGQYLVRAMIGSTPLTSDSALNDSNEFNVSFAATADMRVFLEVRLSALNKVVMRRYLGNVKKPTVDSTIQKIVIDEKTTAKAAIVTAVLDRQALSTTLENAEKQLLAVELSTEGNTDFSIGVDPTDQLLDSFLALSAFSELENMVKTVLAVIEDDVLEVNNVLTVDIRNPTNLAQAAQQALSRAKDSPLTISIADRVQTLTLGGVVVNTTTLANIPTLDAAKQVFTDIGNEFKKVVIPEVSGITVDGKSIYTKANGAINSVTSNSNKPEFVVVFSEAMTVSTPYIVAKVTETRLDSGVDPIVRYVQHGGTKPSGYLSWGDVFNATPDQINGLAFTFKVIGETITPAAGATVRVDLIAYKGIVTQQGARPLAQPVNLYGFFTTPAQ